ncbi:hypothetical protein BJ165DRAFT_1545287 [Panaeolus papilionaceus]|nr:hypothetical protein BJ165DRAFT_1545287 [Panaeolus papilionaceus]
MCSRDVVLRGYYRYTDIAYEWYKALPDSEDAKPLTALLACNALVNPQHPLHVESVDGIQLYLGTFDNGKTSLLFSSKQVDYIRYWLWAMRLTKGIIHLPYSDCLLLKENFATVSPVVYGDELALKEGLKKVSQSKNLLKQLYVTQCRSLFEDTRARWSSKKGVWFALDFEAWEMQHDVLTEFGWSLVRWEDGEKIKRTGHLIVEENQGYINSQYVKNYDPESRYRFNFGSQEIVKYDAFKERIHKMFEDLKQYAPVYLVFHNDSQDLKYLTQLGIKLENVASLLSLDAEDPAHHEWFKVDTSNLIAALLGSPKGDQKGLDKTCQLLSIPTKNLHNGGNDACYTMLALEAMASGPSIGEQKEKRGPTSKAEHMSL